MPDKSWYKNRYLPGLILAPTLSPPTDAECHVQLNLSAVRNHYEVQIAAMGIRGVPNEQQAMAGVQKKGTAGLKFKSKPAIAAHAYAEVGLLSQIQPFCRDRWLMYERQRL